MKIYLIGLLAILLLSSVTSATTNLDFRLDVEEKGFYPNEKIPLNVTIINRDATFAARDAELTVNIGDRFYTFDLGNLKPGEMFQKEITLPEFSTGTHGIKGEINYTGILDERFVEMSYGSFEVLFPPIERYPRNVYVSAYDLPEKIISGKEYDVSITITNDWEVSADLLIEFGSIDEFFEEKTKLEPGESATVKMEVKFDNPGVSLIEARAYALINGEKYLLNYRGKKTYVQGEREAKLIFDRIELINEGDNKINQEDSVKYKVFIKNDGDTATDVKGELSSNIQKINISDSSVSYVTIANKDSFAPSEDVFEMETKGIETGDYELNLKLSYIDSENREKEIKVPISVNEGGDICTKNTDCLDTQTCENSQCKEIKCVDGFIKNRECIKYECARDSQCSDIQICNLQIHKCIEKSGCIKILDNGDSSTKADIAFVGDGYIDLNNLKEDVLKLVDYDGKFNGLMSVEPFKSNKNKFNIWMIKADNKIGYQNGKPNYNDAMSIVAQCTSADYTLVISKKEYRSYCYFGTPCFNSVGNPLDTYSGRLILHEFGHGFAHLTDEYSEVGKPRYPREPNCAPDIQTAKTWWGDLEGKEGVGYYGGCSYAPENIRPTKNSIMFHHWVLKDDYYPVNERKILEVINKYS